MKKFIFVIAILIIIPNTAFSQVAIQAQISHKTITLEDEAKIILVVTGKPTLSPVAPNVRGLDIILTNQTRSFEYQNGVMTYKSQFVFTVVASSNGDYEIPPFSVFYNGREYLSKPLKLKVTPPGLSQPSQNQQIQGFSQIQQNPQKSSNDNNQKPAPFLIQTEVSKSSPYESEPIIYRFKFLNRIHVSANQVQFPKFENFYVELIEPEKKGREFINGHDYATIEVIYALYPLKPGLQRIEPVELQVNYREPSKLDSRGFRIQTPLDPFGRGKMVRKKVKSNAVNVDVQKLPEPKPKDFTNLVGQYSFTSKLSEQNIKLGDSVTLTIEVSGEGNIKDAILPQWDNPNFNIYENKPELKMDTRSDGIFGTKTFEMVLIPTQSGGFNISDLSMSYFDPNLKKYVSLSLPDYSLVVKDAQNKIDSQPIFANDSNNQPDLTKTTNQTPIAPVYQEYANVNKPIVSRDFLITLLYALPILSLFLLGLRKIPWKKITVNPRKKKFKQRYSKLTEILQQPNPSVEEVLLLVKKVLSVIFKKDLASYTSFELQKLFESQNLQDKEVLALSRFLERLESQNYGFAKEQDQKFQAKAVKRNIEELWKKFS